MLTVPDIRQAADYDCGDAAVDAALGALGVRRRRGTRLSNAIQGTAPETVAAVLRAAGVTVSVGPVLTGIAGLRHLTAHGCPVLCPIAERGGHWVVVRGVTGGPCRGRVWLHCPAEGPTSRRWSDWLAVWHDESDAGHNYRQWGVAVCR